MVQTVFTVFFKDKDVFIEEYKALLPLDSPDIVFSHNDVSDVNFLSNGSETKIIDFEYSSLNYKGVDIAEYLNESTMDYHVTEAPKYAWVKEYDVNFGEPDQSLKGVHADTAIKLYLQRFYECHKDKVSGFSFKSLEEYMDAEFPILRAKVHKLVI